MFLWRIKWPTSAQIQTYIKNSGTHTLRFCYQFLYIFVRGVSILVRTIFGTKELLIWSLSRKKVRKRLFFRKNIALIFSDIDIRLETKNQNFGEHSNSHTIFLKISCMNTIVQYWSLQTFTTTSFKYCIDFTWKDFCLSLLQTDYTYTKTKSGTC